MDANGNGEDISSDRILRRRNVHITEISRNPGTNRVIYWILRRLERVGGIHVNRNVSYSWTSDR